jgi:hypothetical protein
VYQVKPSEQLVFHSGRIDRVDGDVPLDCGCPPPPAVQANPSQVAEANTPANSSLTLATDNANSGTAGNTNANPVNESVGSNNTGQTLSSGPETRPLPTSQPNDIHLEVEAPLVFHGNEKKATQPAPGSAPAAGVQGTSASPPHVDAQIQPPSTQAPTTAATAPPPQSMKPEHHGVLHKIKGFFASLFR